jgi:hypothetical protein
MPPKPAKLTVSKGGIMMSASLAETPMQAPNVITKTTINNQYLLFFIIKAAETIAESYPLKPTQFLGNVPHV